MKFSRAAGVLLHPTSLPSDYCIGELGSSAYRFIDFLEKLKDKGYLARPDDNIVWDLIREAFSSVSNYAIIPMQDILVLDTESRMNIPSTLEDSNWSWRMQSDDMTDFIASRLKGMVEFYGR